MGAFKKKLEHGLQSPFGGFYSSKKQNRTSEYEGRSQ
jgi:hypothetical protein